LVPDISVAHPRPAADSPSIFDRLSFASGIAASAFALLGAILFIVYIVPDLPPIHAPVDDRAEFYRSMARNGVYRSIGYLGEMQVGLLLLFFGGLFGVLRRAEGGSGAMSFAVFGAGVTLAVITPLSIMIEDHLMFGMVAGGHPAIVASIDGLGPISFALGGFPQAIVLAGTAALLMRAQIIPRAIGWVGIALAFVSLVGTGTLVRGSMFPISSLTMLLFRVWLLILAALLLRRSLRTVSVTARTALEQAASALSYQ
jgi:hypothetical protein